MTQVTEIPDYIESQTDQGWILDKEMKDKSNAIVIVDPNVAWKLFSKSWRPEQVFNEVDISGNLQLGRNVLNIVAFMA